MARSVSAYIQLDQTGGLEKRARQAIQRLEKCDLCPQECKKNRLNNEIGQCHIGKKARVYSYFAHHGEEKPISGRYGSGTIFFSGCNLHCQFCQNWEISQEPSGRDVNAQELAGIMISLQNYGCHNINFVSPSHVVPQILNALVIAGRAGLSIPLVYNTGGYDAISTLKLLDGIVDIYMPDMKYSDSAIAEKCSKIKNYPQINRKAVKEMFRQVGDLQINSEGIAVRGLLIRHLILPNQLAGTNETLKFIANEISHDTYINIMAQYHPAYKAAEYPDITRGITHEEYRNAVKKAWELGLHRLDK